MWPKLRKVFIHPGTWAIYTILVFVYLWLTDTDPEDPQGLWFLFGLLMLVLSGTGALYWFTREDKKRD